ncbi:MAG: SAM-dependent chlorinase/fluorinase [Patescibacteria group bacterium]
MQKPFISISTDFGPGNKGLGVMRATILMICPEAEIIDLANDITGFDTTEGAKLLESVFYLQRGFHICVVDPGVGTKRRGIAIETGRGDFLIGPDNGVLIPATRNTCASRSPPSSTEETFLRQSLRTSLPVFPQVRLGLRCL